MKQTNFTFNPFRFAAILSQASLEVSVSMTQFMLDQMDAAAKSLTKHMEWTSVELPVLKAMPIPDEKEMRLAFQKSADVQLRNWEHAANLLSALPDWADWPQRVPGRVLTDLFDSMQRARMFPEAANDAWPVTLGLTDKAAPPVMTAPQGVPDELTRIKGLGPKLSADLSDLGIFHFRQIAEWSPEQANWIDKTLGCKGRVARDKWVRQAKDLASAVAA